MHILVSIKRVVDPNVKVRVKSDGSGVETSGVKMSINPFDEVAVEQAVRLKERGLARKVTVVALGAAISQDVLRTALAMGADAAVLIETDGRALEPQATARLLQAFVAREPVDLVLCGKQDIDDDLGATAPMLAALLDWPQAISANRMQLDGARLEVGCDADQGSQQLALDLPAVVSVDLRLCEPRNITLPAMMRAKKATLQTVAAADLQAAVPATTRPLQVSEPPARAAGVRLESVAALVERLRELPVLQP
ncbi:electron transfer flavoprotein beta subunit [Lampropedia hyalina DSM 16112]|jgi:electron transfer flavoprotein beta subunit|uniref:Electron transfer flavoprotein subunit beta n=1 Tax=Lampropedia hyalina DSM 16112 TaxID=1122156 RepID=A0A1M4TA87_9BURK|nr:electron transfer flavoprotein subunit beta/FixA family protein [Lampropedia hyalina]SHE41157.1 electron transfer flavoprotein beta subunit [Lampropedia hyalina DSM 16112]